MRRLAVSAGIPQERYTLGTIPEDLETLSAAAPFDLMALMRLSVGHFSVEQMTLLIAFASRTLRVGGRLVIETYSVPQVIAGTFAVDPVVGTWPLSDGAEIGVSRPCGQMVWEPDDWIRTWPLKIEWRKGGEIVRSDIFETRERLFSPAELERMARGIGGLEPVALDYGAGVFEGLGTICLERR